MGPSHDREKSSRFGRRTRTLRFWLYFACFMTNTGPPQIRCQEGERRHEYDLDERLVEFGTAVHDSDFGRAVLYLESLEDSDDHRYEVDGMWQNLADIGLQLMNLPVAARCLAGVGDHCKAWYLRETCALADRFAEQNSYVRPRRVFFFGI